MATHSMRTGSVIRQVCTGACLAGFLFAAVGCFPIPGLNTSPAIAQIIRAEGLWRKVYEELPDFPRENQYVSKETNKVAQDDTLVGRLIRYHLYVKGRPPFFRLDWKVTLADYLGVVGRIDEEDYPSVSTLRKNPLEGDIAAIRQLNRSQRDALVQALVDAFVSQSGRIPQTTPKPIVPLPGK